MATKKNTAAPEQTDFTEPEETTPAQPETVGEAKDVLVEEEVIGAAGTGTGSTQPQPEWKIPTGDAPPQDPNAGQGAGNQQGPPPGGQTFTQPPPKDEEEPIGDIPPGSKADGAKWVANKVVDGWGELKRRVGNWACLIPERKLEKMHDKGEIDLNAPIYLNYATQDGGQMRIPMMGAVRNFNASVKDKFGVSEQVRQDAVPILTGIFMRKNIAATPEMQLVAIAAVDTFQFIEGISEVRNIQGDLLSAIKDTYQMWREAGSPKTEPPASTIINPEPVQPAPQQPVQEFTPEPEPEPQAQPQSEWTPPPQPQSTKPPRKRTAGGKLLKPHPKSKRKPRVKVR